MSNTGAPLPSNLFDSMQRTDTEPSAHDELPFSYLNRSATSHAARVRAVLDEWYARLPDSVKSDIYRRYRSNTSGDHEAVFFEICTHELLLKLNLKPNHHPDLPGTSRRPDFLVWSAEGEFYFEATTVAAKSKSKQSAEARINQVFAILDREVTPQFFFLSIHHEGLPKSQPPAKKWADQLNTRLARLDPDVLLAEMAAGNRSLIPTWHFSHAGWSVEFQPIPKSPAARNRPGARPIGSMSTGFERVDHAAHIRSSITSKGGRYGNLGLPYVVAVNVLQPIDDFDVLQALFGTEQWPVVEAARRGDAPAVGPMFRLRDGAWTGKKGPRYTRVSAVLIVGRATEYHIAGADARLFHNPWASRPVGDQLGRLPQASRFAGHYRNMEGESLASILGLAEAWPESISEMENRFAEVARPNSPPRGGSLT